MRKRPFRWLNFRYLQYRYIDTIDPEGAFAKIAFRAAFACTLSILFFQIVGNQALSNLAGFISFAFVQTDTQELFLKKLPFLLTVIFSFTSLATLAMAISGHTYLFILLTPLITFICAYPACLGFNYLNAGSWAIVIYILAGDTPVNLHSLMTISATFMICGAITLSVCYFIFPARPHTEIILTYERLLKKILLIFDNKIIDTHTYPYLYKQRINTQLDQLLMLLDKKLTLYLTNTTITPTQETDLILLTKLFNQACLMAKSAVAAQEKRKLYPDFCNQAFEKGNQLISMQIKQLIALTRSRALTLLPKTQTSETLLSYRNILMQERLAELINPSPNYAKLMNSSNYFYHFIQLESLFEKIELLLPKVIIAP